MKEYSKDEVIMSFFARVSFYQDKLLKIQQTLTRKMEEDFKSFVAETNFHLLVKNLGEICAGTSIPMPDPGFDWSQISEKYRNFEQQLIMRDKPKEWFFYPEEEAAAIQRRMLEKQKEARGMEGK